MIITELSVGNWVEYNGNFYRITSIDRDMNYLDQKKYRIFISRGKENNDLETITVNANELKPILIDVKILDKNNFQSIGGDYFPNKDFQEYSINVSHNDFFIFKHNGTARTNTEVPFRAVHELQNIWSNIVKEELNIKI